MSEPINQLDLSKFANIVPPSPEQQKTEIDRRSQGITAIKAIMENLLNAMQSYLSDLEALDSQANYLEQQRSELAEIDKQVRFSHHELELKEANIDEQLKYIETENQTILEKKLTIDAKETEKEKEFNQRDRELTLKEQKAEILLKQSADIQEKLNLLTDRQKAVDIASSADQRRKQLLDLREQKILAREVRLERLEHESRVG